MPAALRALLSSSLADRYRLEVAPTYRDARPLPRLGLFCLALARLAGWSVRGRGRIVHVHATVRGSAYRKSVCVLLARALGRRVVLHVHSGEGDIAAFSASRGRLSRALFGAAFGAADTVLAVSHASAEALARAGLTVPVEVVPNAAPLPAAPSAGSGEGPVRVAYIGGFANRAKGGDVLVDALARRDGPALEVTLAGPGKPPAEAEALLSRGSGVRWVGWLDEEAKAELLGGADVFVMPSRSEGLPMALLEAMGYGLAVAATRAGGIPEALEDGEEGILVAPEDPQALAAAIDRLAGDAGLRRRLGAAARRRAERLDEVEVAGRLAGLYLRLGAGRI